MEIYHGSNIAVTEPLANAGRRNLDFGKGFYTTRLKSQAQKWAYLVASRKEKNPQGIISKYEFDEECLSQQGYVYKNFPVSGAVNKMKTVGTPWIFNMVKESEGNWKDGNIIDPSNGKMYGCVIKYLKKGEKNKKHTS